MEFLNRFDWTATLLTETEKQAVEDILVDYHDIFARHRMDIGMNTEFKLKLTQTKNSSSSRKQMVKMKPKKKSYNEKSNLRKWQQNG